MTPKRVEMALIYKIQCKVNALFGSDVRVNRTLMSRRFSVNRTDMVITSSGGRDKLETIRALFLSDFMLEGWTNSTEAHAEHADELVRHYRGFEVTLYVGPISRHALRFDLHGYVRRLPEALIALPASRRS